MEESKAHNKIDIFQSVKSTAINELTPELLETGFDLLTESEILKDIPVFGIGFKGFSLYKKVTESFFTKKLLNFLFELKEIPQTNREEFISQLESKNETKKAGRNILVSLTRLGDEEKATIMGKLFKNTILGNMGFSDFNRLTHIIDGAYIEDLKALQDNYILGGISDDVKINLHQIGLVKQSLSDIKRQKKLNIRLGGTGEDVQPKFEYRVNQIGSILIENGFDKDSPQK
ncbi:hypothetical protein [Zobellia uliginosa]|uniref:hypothetical protein n=1 Tax=Zobellia uliginosa TaxID=143224 RepID=UPI001C07032C|nr:hypothetical protein [Zobellia uliginosa]MBU2947953.1 hypothetical protein [Zobellia uliginosa]